MALRKEGPLAFDKDDDLALSFLVGAACLRMQVFHIPVVTHFKAKEMVGNIIPAIASTNAMVSALQLIELLKHLRLDQPAASRQLYVQNTMVKKIIASRPDPPREECRVCAVGCRPIHLQFDFNRVTLKVLLNLIEKHSTIKEYSLIIGSSLLYFIDPYIDESELLENAEKEKKFISAFIKK